MMLNRVYRTSFFSFVSRGSFTLTNFIVIYFIGRYFHEKGLGVYGILYFFSFLFSALSSYGMQLYFSKETASRRSNKSRLKNIFSEFLSVSIVGTTLAILLLIILLYTYKEVSSLLITLSFLWGIFFGLEMNVSGFILGFEKMEIDALINIFKLVATVVFFYSGKNKISFLTAIVFLSFLAFFSFIVKFYVSGLMSSLVFEKNFLSNIKITIPKEGKYFFLSQLNFLLYRQAEIFSLSFFSEKNSLGLYFLFLRLFFGFALISEIVSFSITPFLSRTYSAKEKISMKDFVKKISYRLFILGVIIGVLSFVFGERISLLFGVRPGDMLFILKIFSILIPLRFVSYIFGATLTSTKFQNIRFYITFFVYLFLFLGSMPMYIFFQWKGVLVLRVLVEVFIFVLYFYFLKLVFTNENSFNS